MDFRFRNLISEKKRRFQNIEKAENFWGDGERRNNKGILKRRDFTKKNLNFEKNKFERQAEKNFTEFSKPKK